MLMDRFFEQRLLKETRLTNDEHHYAVGWLALEDKTATKKQG